MGLRCLVLDPDPNAPACQVAPYITGSIYDESSLRELFAKCERVTLENEFVPGETIDSALRKLDHPSISIIPSSNSLKNIQDKWIQRKNLVDSGVPGPEAQAIEAGSAHKASEYGFPVVLKSRLGGYDGKGTIIARTQEDLSPIADDLNSGRFLMERFVKFVREISVMVYTHGDEEYYCLPTMETRQEENVCDVTFPADIDASEVAIAAIRAVAPGSAGLFGVELFELENGEIWVNEIAPRPHNTGHYTLDWGVPSQFDIHICAAMGYPFPDVTEGKPCAMANLLGQAEAKKFQDGIPPVLAMGAHFHWYGKQDAKPGRKMGHINAVGASPEEALTLATAAREAFYKSWCQK